MSQLDVKPLKTDVNFGIRVAGVTRTNLQEETIRSQLISLFEKYGLIVFEDVESTDAMQIEISRVFGPLKEHPIPTVPRAKIDNLPGVINIEHDPEDPNILQIEGRQLSQWLPWHFDHSYNDKLNRGGVLRAITIAPEGGRTGFVDGIDLYNSISPKLRQQLNDINVIYVLDPLFSKYRFGLPRDFKTIRLQQVRKDTASYVSKLPRAIHPAVWERHSGEKVLHMSPFMAMGIEGNESPDGDRLFAEICTEILSSINPYFHEWKSTDMLIWDNWRMLHSSTGIDPKYSRKMHRTTIEGDYGYGYFEDKKLEEFA